MSALGTGPRRIDSSFPLDFSAVNTLLCQVQQLLDMSRHCRKFSTETGSHLQILPFQDSVSASWPLHFRTVSPRSENRTGFLSDTPMSRLSLLLSWSAPTHSPFSFYFEDLAPLVSPVLSRPSPPRWIFDVKGPSWAVGVCLHSTPSSPLETSFFPSQTCCRSPSSPQFIHPHATPSPSARGRTLPEPVASQSAEAQQYSAAGKSARLRRAARDPLDPARRRPTGAGGRLT